MTDLSRRAALLLAAAAAAAPGLANAFADPELTARLPKVVAGASPSPAASSSSARPPV